MGWRDYSHTCKSTRWKYRLGNVGISFKISFKRTAQQVVLMTKDIIFKGWAPRCRSLQVSGWLSQGPNTQCQSQIVIDRWEDQYSFTTLPHLFTFVFGSLELPSTPLIYDATGAVIENFSAPLKLGSHLKLKCQTRGGKLLLGLLSIELDSCTSSSLVVICFYFLFGSENKQKSKQYLHCLSFSRHRKS